MFSFAVCFFGTVFVAALAEEYVPLESYLYHPYETEYAPKYDNYEPKDYHFQYAVSDPHTGDHKQQWEVKEKGVVRGMYSLLEPDGTIRVVEYIADDGGFRATVKKLGHPIDTPHHQQDTILPLAEAYGGGYHGAYSGLGENYGIANYATAIQAGQGEKYGGENYIVPIELGHGGHHQTGSYEAQAPIELGHGGGHGVGGYIAPIELAQEGHYEAGSYLAAAPIELGHGANHGGYVVAPIELGHAGAHGVGGYAAPIELGHGGAHGVGSYVAPIELGHGGGHGAGSYVAPVQLGYGGAKSYASLSLGSGGGHGGGSYAGPTNLGNAHGSVEVHGFTGNQNDGSSYANYDGGNDEHKTAIYYQNYDGNSQGGNNYGWQGEPISAPSKLTAQYQKPYAYSYVG